MCIVDSSNTDLNPLPIQALLRSVFDELTITLNHIIKTASEKFTDHPGIEPGTFGSLDQCSTNWANESDGEEHWFYNHMPSVHTYPLTLYNSLINFAVNYQRVRKNGVLYYNNSSTIMI